MVFILEQVAGALREAHEAGLIHRDIKPANIILSRQGAAWDIAKVVDFGLVKNLGGTASPDATEEGKLLGTPRYMAPEAIKDHNLQDARSDLYALGAVGYYLLTGEHVFAGATVVEALAHHLHSAPVAPSVRLGKTVPEDLERIILACLEKEPDRRPRDALTLRDQLRATSAHGSWSEADASLWWEEHGESLRSRPMPVSETLAIDLRAL